MGASMTDWNVVVSVRGNGFANACELLGDFGSVRRTEYYNILVMRVDDTDAFIREFSSLVEIDPHILTFVGRVIPVVITFTFQDVDEFERKGKEAALRWLPELAGKSFHVRMYRRGFKGRMSSQEEERILAEVLIEALDGLGTPGRVTFVDPDAILAVETVGGRAGLSLWTRDDLKRYPFLGLD